MSVSLYGSGNTIIQVPAQGFLTTNFSTTSQSYVSTGLSATITPQSTTSKILVLTFATAVANGTNGGAYAIYRNGSQVFNPSARDSSTSNYLWYGSNPYGNISLSYIDSPASTSALTYTLYASSYSGGSVSLNYGGTVAGTASIIVLEISGS